MRWLDCICLLASLAFVRAANDASKTSPRVNTPGNEFVSTGPNAFPTTFALDTPTRFQWTNVAGSVIAVEVWRDDYLRGILYRNFDCPNVNTTLFPNDGRRVAYHCNFKQPNNGTLSFGGGYAKDYDDPVGTEYTKYFETQNGALPPASGYTLRLNWTEGNAIFLSTLVDDADGWGNPLAWNSTNNITYQESPQFSLVRTFNKENTSSQTPIGVGVGVGVGGAIILLLILVILWRRMKKRQARKAREAIVYDHEPSDLPEVHVGKDQGVATLPPYSELAGPEANIELENTNLSHDRTHAEMGSGEMKPELANTVVMPHEMSSGLRNEDFVEKDHGMGVEGEHFELESSEQTTRNPITSPQRYQHVDNPWTSHSEYVQPAQELARSTEVHSSEPPNPQEQGNSEEEIRRLRDEEKRIDAAIAESERLQALREERETIRRKLAAAEGGKHVS